VKRNGISKFLHLNWHIQTLIFPSLDIPHQRVIEVIEISSDERLGVLTILNRQMLICLFSEMERAHIPQLRERCERRQSLGDDCS
jgi:hypothetical protein